MSNTCVCVAWDCQAKVHAALCDDFDTPTTLHALLELVGAVNRHTASHATAPVAPELVCEGLYVCGSFVSENSVNVEGNY